MENFVDEIGLAFVASESELNQWDLHAKNIFQRNQERSVDDHMAEEMQHALNAYGKVALKRFIDTVPMICVEVMQKFSNSMNHILSDTSDDEIDRFITAPPNTVTKMNKLKRKADTLEKGIVALGELY